MKIFYFGCWGEAGHFLWRPGHLTVRSCQSEGLPFHQYYFLDGGPFLPRTERKGDAALTHIPGWTVLAWWGSPWDDRTGVNAAIIAEGLLDGVGILMAFNEAFPDLAAKLLAPAVLPKLVVIDGAPR